MRLCHMLETLEYFVNQMDSYYKQSMESKQPERYGKNKSIAKNPISDKL